MNKFLKLSLLFSQLAFVALFPIWIQLTRYLHPLVIGVVWFCLTALVLLATLWLTKDKISISKQTLNWITLFYCIGLLILLFFRPENQYYGAFNLVPFTTIYFYLSGRVDFLIALYNLSANIGLFMPFGLYFCYVKTNPSLRSLFFITVLSISVIEGLQFITKRGSFDIDDIILNAVGVCLGYLIHPFFKKVVVVRSKKKAPLI